MCCLLFQIAWNINDHNSIEWAFLQRNKRIYYFEKFEYLTKNLFKQLIQYNCIGIYSDHSELHIQAEPTLTQIPQPMHSSSDKLAIFEFGLTSIHSLPIRTTGQHFLHS